MPTTSPRSHHARTHWILFALATACGGRPEPGLDPLVGVWTTQDELYAGRWIEIHATHEITIGIGPETADPSPILSVESGLPIDQRQGYAIAYLDPDGEESVLEVDYFERQKVLRLRSRPTIVWTRGVPP